MTYADAISIRLLNICKERNITVNKLSTLSGISHSTIQDLVTGKSKNVKLKTLHKIAVGLDMTILLIFTNSFLYIFIIKRICIPVVSISSVIIIKYQSSVPSRVKSM